MLVFELFCNWQISIDVWAISFDKQKILIDENGDSMHAEEICRLLNMVKIMAIGYLKGVNQILVNVMPPKAGTHLFSGIMVGLSQHCINDIK